MNRIIQCINKLLATLIMASLFGCGQRFATTPIYEYQYEYEESPADGQTNLLLPETFEQDDVVQFLIIHEKQGWKNISQDQIRQWSERYDQSAEVLELVSDYYRIRGDLDNALKFNGLAEKHGASSIEFYKKRAHLYTAMGEYSLAIDYINKAVMINGSDPDTYLTKGKVYLQLGDSLSALRNMQRALENDSSRLDIAADMAHLYANAKDDNSAVAMIDFLISNDYLSTEMSYLKAGIDRRRGEDVLANRLLSELLQAGETEAGVELVAYFKRLNALDSAIYYATKILEQDSLNLSAMEAKAFAFDRKGYFTSALIYYNQMLDIDSLNKEALEGIRKVNGKIAYLRKLREQREAIPTFDFAAPINRNNLIDE